MKKSELKTIIREAIEEILTDPKTNPILNEFEEWAKTSLKAKKKDGVHHGGMTYSLDSMKETFVVEFYKWNFATAQLYLNIPENKIHVEKYYDSEWMDEEYRYNKKYTIEQKDDAKKDFIKQLVSIKNDLLSDQG